MATAKELQESSNTAEKRAAAFRRSADIVFDAVIAAFDKVLETNTYRIAQPKGDDNWKEIGARSTFNSGSRWVQTITRRDGLPALRLGVIPDHERRFTVLWVDLVIKNDMVTLHVAAAANVNIDLETFDIEKQRADIESLVKQATDTLLADYNKKEYALETLLEHYNR